MRRLSLAALGSTLLATGVVLAVPAGAAADITVVVPAAGQSAHAEFTGTIQPGSDPTSDCSTTGGAFADSHTVHIDAPAGGYAGIESSFTFAITWTPSTGVDASNDEVLEVDKADGTVVGTSDGGTDSEGFTVKNLPTGDYVVLACPSVNLAPQDYKGTIDVKTVVTGAGSPTSHTVNDKLTTYTPATVVDPVLFGGEPGVNADPTTSDGHRVFVDWPVSSRQNIGVLYRSDDSGVTFRKRFADVTDPTEAGPLCLGRQIPYCPAGGGGDTDVNIDPNAGNLYMSSQESLANQSVGTSFDHGTTFPADHADAIVDKGAADVDRQWLANYGNGKDVFLAYHSPLLGEYVNHSSQAGAVGSWGVNPVPTVPGVTQSGALIADNHLSGKHILYLAYYADGINSAADGGSQPAVLTGDTPISGFAVAVSTDDGASFVNYKIPGGGNPRNFVKLNVDNHGNVYAVWTDSTNQQTYLATSTYDATNPGKTWKGPFQVSGAPLNVTIFPDVVAGDPGRIAIIYYGTAANATTPDTVKPGQGGWYPYVAVSTNARCMFDATPCSAPTFHQTTVAHKLNQDDNICTSGTACAATGGNRNLLDYWDVTLDRQGHLKFVWGDTTNGIGLPYVKVAQEATGPSLYAAGSAASASMRANGVADAAGDAIFPLSGANVTTAPNHPTLDLRGTSVAVRGSNLEFRVKLASTKDLGAGVPTGNDGLTPLQQAKYLVRWDFGKAVYYAGANVASGSGSTPTFFSGTVSTAEGLLAAGSTDPYGNTYASGGSATGKVTDGVLTIDVPLSAVGSPKLGSRLLSVGSYTLVGPPDQLATLNTAPVQADSTPTFDTVLAAASSPAPSPSPSSTATSPSGSQSPGSGSSGGAGSAEGDGSLARTGGSAVLTTTGLALLALAGIAGRRRRVGHRHG